ncbi:MAG TPA: Ig-like domain-containing protein [Terriglobales bacterium]|nr:Ig-like domain-containing protein [Terriglobales bacterium]
MENVMNALRGLLFLSALLLITSCGGGSATSGEILHVSLLTILPQFVFLTSGNSEQLSVSEKFNDGTVRTPHSPTWSSSDRKVAGVNSQGIVSALGAGAATITCTDQGITASTTVTVQPAFSTRAYQSGTFLYLENAVGPDIIRLGMDSSFGGGVSEFSLNGSDVVAKASYGSHIIGLGLYDGNGTYDSCNGCTGTYGWNPVECCDTYRHGSPVLAQSITGTTIYIKTDALEWIPDHKGGGPTQPVPSDIILERWFSPVANHPYVFKERYKITHTGTDRHAVQTNAVASYEITAKLFDQFVAYTGNAARTGASPTILQTSQMPQWPVAGSVLLLSEGWGAFTNQQGFGFAAYSPQGFPYSAPNQATSDPTDQELGFSFFSPFSFTPGSSVQFDTFLMQGNYTTMQWETYDINRRLGPFVDISPPLGDINSTPANGSTVTGQISIDGWAFDSISATHVDLYVDNVLIASGSANITRPDIAMAYPGAPPDPAFHFVLDTTQLTNAMHVIEVRATDLAGNVGLLPHRIVLVNN